MTHSMPTDGDIFESLRLELRRGSLILAVLGQLEVEHYGYTLRKALAEAGVEIEEGALYPMLRRLESQGLLASEWREEDRRNKRFYRLSPQGREILDRLAAEWRGLNASLSGILKGEP
jgi:PadR family transcriptional regulator, regulatory protein PadR